MSALKPLTAIPVSNPYSTLSNVDEVDADKLIIEESNTKEFQSMLQKVSKLDDQRKDLCERTLFLMTRLGHSNIKINCKIKFSVEEFKNSDDLAKLKTLFDEMTKQNEELSRYNREYQSEYEALVDQQRPRIVIRREPTYEIVFTREKSYEEYTGDYSRRNSNCGGGIA